MSNAYAVFFDAVPGAPRPARDSVVAHCQALRRLEDQGLLIAAGPFADGSGGVVIARFADERDARDYAARDAFVTSGCRTARVVAWEHSHRGNGHLGVLEPQAGCPTCGAISSAPQG